MERRRLWKNKPRVFLSGMSLLLILVAWWKPGSLVNRNQRYTKWPNSQATNSEPLTEEITNSLVQPAPNNGNVCFLFKFKCLELCSDLCSEIRPILLLDFHIIILRSRISLRNLSQEKRIKLSSSCGQKILEQVGKLRSQFNHRSFFHYSNRLPPIRH